MLGSAGGNDGAHLFPTALSVTSFWQLEIGHNGIIYSPEIGEHYRSKVFCPGELLVKHVSAYHSLSPHSRSPAGRSPEKAPSSPQVAQCYNILGLRSPLVALGPMFQQP